MINIKKYIIAFLSLLLTCVVLSAVPSAVEFLGMDASVQDLSVILNWATATETENQGFILERKTDSLSSWEPLASYINSDALVGQGTVSTQTDYTYTDSLVTSGETYFYRISGIDNASNIGLLDSLSITIGEVGLAPIIPSAFILTAYPNPFNPRIVISLQYPVNSNTSVNIYDIQGVLVDQLINGFIDAGRYELTWDASGMPSGVYIVMMQAANMVRSQKIVLMK